ncbi:zinc finger protein ZAT1 [Lycium ferocissimum]|uniref:zinc finger protein ZAT1 n=1 Tax=Lycium ferocissimum TaxID=112874 RepID=UPI00281696BA|nr:zinc finger protein ZAT1 [Lycium ferocissimum]
MVDYQDHRVGKETLWIKLKISEDDVLEDHKQVLEDHKDDVVDEDEDEKEVQINPKNNDDNNTRICHVCNKGFRSGKALGGHMRIHVQASKKQLYLSGKKCKKLKPLVDRYYKKRILQQDHEEKLDLENCDNQLLPTCSICGKNFPSMKSLFGHMRCHPERAWRGIQPPHLKSPDDNKKTTSAITESEDLLVSATNEMDKKTASATTDTASGGDLSKPVPGWSVKSKRGRKPVAEESTNSGLKDEEQLRDAVNHLMLLANGDSVLESGLTGGGYDNKHGIREELETTNSNSLTSKAETDQELAYCVSESMINENKKKRRKKMKFLDSVKDAASPVSLDHDQNTPEKYKCNTCEKSFTTHQALGGHMSSHNKFRMVILNSDITNEEASASSSKLLDDSKLCYSNKKFPTNRCQLTSPSEFSNINGRRILDFDLNELPPDHEDEVADHHGYFSFLPI